MVELRDISIGYGRRVLARGLCARFEAGTLNAIIGRNGAGKSTLLRVIAGLEKPLGGEVFYNQESGVMSQESADAGGKLDDETIRRLGDELTRRRSCAAQTDAREGLQPAASGGGWLTGSESPKNTDTGGGLKASAKPEKPAALPLQRLITHNSSLITLPRERLVSFVSTERPRVANLRVGDVVALGRAPYTGWLGRLSDRDERIVRQSLETVGIASFAAKQLDTLSDGEAQRVMIARALAQDTPVILLDEPTAFLDFHSRREIVELLHGLAHGHGKTVIFSSHELDLVKEFSDKIIEL